MATQKELLQKVNELEISIVEALSEIKAQHALHEQSFEEIKDTLERVEHAIYGNGKPGIIENVAVQNQRIKTIWGLITGIAAALLAIIIEVVVRLI